MAKAIRQSHLEQFMPFSYWYTMVTTHSRFDDMKYEEFQPLFKSKGKVLAEFLVASGKDTLSFGVLKDTLDVVDAYLRDGVFDGDAMDAMDAKLEAETEILVPIVADYIKAGKADKEGNGAPLVLFIYSYGSELLKTCRMVHDEFEPELQEKLRHTLWEIRRNDPDSEPDSEKIPEHS